MGVNPLSLLPFEKARSDSWLRPVFRNAYSMIFTTNVCPRQRSAELQRTTCTVSKAVIGL